jgi:hypothetical protein
MNNTNRFAQAAIRKNVIVASALYPGLNKESGHKTAGNRNGKGQGMQKPLPPGTELIPLTKKEIRKLKRAHRRNLNYFYVMRRFVCFLMALCFIVYTVVIVLGIVPYTAPYTAYATIPDNTPLDIRDEVFNETQQYYLDQSVGISAIDILYGYISSILGMGDSAANAAEEESGETEETPSATQETAPKVNYYQKYLQLLEDRESSFEPTDRIFVFAFKYTPIAMAIAFLTMLITMFKSIFALRGRRIRQAFGLSAIILFLSAVFVAIGLIGLSNAANANPNGLNDLSQLSVFFTSVFYGAPYTVEDLLIYPPLTLTGGLLVPVMVIVPVLILIFSFFCKKKAYYTIFNK